MKTSARWAIHSIICLHCAAAVVIGALAGLSGMWMNALVATAIAYPVNGLAVLAGIEMWKWWRERGSTMRETYVYRDGNGTGTRTNERQNNENPKPKPTP